jgi:hypothetical protein
MSFGEACDRWLDYIQNDRKRRTSHVRDCRSAVGEAVLDELTA